MPFTKSRRSSSVSIAPRRTQVVAKSRFEALRTRQQAVAKRLRQAGDEDSDAMIGVGAGLALGLYETYLGKKGQSLPTIGGYDPTIVIGLGGYLLTRKQKSKTGKNLRQASIALATIGANRCAARGSLRVAGDDGEYAYDGDDDNDL